VFLRPKVSVTVAIRVGELVTAAPIRYWWARCGWIQWRKGVNERPCADETGKRGAFQGRMSQGNPKELRKVKCGEVGEGSGYVANHGKGRMLEY